MSQSEQAVNTARDLLLSEYHGVLSTHSVDMEGFPFGSVAPYCLDGSGQPIILISSIAQHTKNILHNAKVSLIVTEREVDDIQTGARLTWLALAQKIEGEQKELCAQRYYRYFPEAADYHLTHNFDFYCLRLQRARFIGGFGKIHWVEKDELLLDNPFSAKDEERIINHMNADHGKAIQHYVETAGIEFEGDAVMVGIDAEGMHLLLGKKIARVAFNRLVNTPLEAREILVEMARA